MSSYPFLFSFRDLIAGNGFVANVTASGRVLLVEENDGDWWLFGVQPGGIAGGNPDRNVALDEFKKSYLSVLLDLAAEATSYKQFESEVKRFFAQVSEPFAADWKKALELVRSGELKYPGIVCIKEAEHAEPRVEVTQINSKTATPDANAGLEPIYAKAA
jgi:hypothetical protein